MHAPQSPAKHSCTKNAASPSPLSSRWNSALRRQGPCMTRMAVLPFPSSLHQNQNAPFERAPTRMQKQFKNEDPI